MIFNSIEFILFFVITLAVHYLLPSRFRWIWALAASTFFYAYAQPAYVPIPAGIALIPYFAGIQLENTGSEKKRQQFFIISTIVIVGILVFFKYSNFFTNTITELVNIIRQKALHSTNTVTNNLLINIAAPLGISYITFQAIGYLIEIKRGNHTAEKHLGHFITYLFFFPKIIAGPVERAHHFLPQLKEPKPFNYDYFTDGAKQLLWGLFKKIVIADRMAIYVNAVYNNYEHHSGITLLVASIFYVLQIYTDFSGYTDMALGIAKMFGFELMPNFNRPLLAKSVTEFWRRWHMSLSTWFADYFYNPIAIEKRNWGTWAVIYASFVTFTVLGFWHGANWTFIVFGFLQGLILSIEIFTRKQRKKLRKKIPQWLNDSTGILFTFGYFGFSSIFFRANSVGDALNIIKKILAFKGPLFTDSTSMLLFLLLAAFYLAAYEFKKEFFDNRFTLSANKYWLIRNGYYCMLIVIILATAVFDGGEFIYFQF
ncbi:MAG: MBOAT family protein [Chitinophagaceae bacterium]|nr:MBOAT family protein [Chitinophagaceae bacterium]